MSDHNHSHASAHSDDPVERIVEKMPVVGGVMMFLLAFIAIYMA